MHIKKSIALVALSLLVSGNLFGHGHPPKKHYFIQKGDVVLFLGNSITNWAAPLVAHLKADISAHYPELLTGDDPVTFITSGVNGEQAFEGLKRLPALLQRHKPTVCVVSYGTCEVTFKNETSYMPAMKKIFDQLEAGGVAVTVVSPPACSPANWAQGDNWPASQFMAGLPIMAAQARKIAKKERVLFADAYRVTDKHSHAGGEELTTDGIHLNPSGYRLMADALQKAWGYGKPLGNQRK